MNISSAIARNRATISIGYYECCYKSAIPIVGQFDSRRLAMKERQLTDRADYRHIPLEGCKVCSSIAENYPHPIVADSYREAFQACQFPHNYCDYHFDWRSSSIGSVVDDEEMRSHPTLNLSRVDQKLSIDY